MRQRYTRMAMTGGAFAVAAVLAGCGQGTTQAGDTQSDSPQASSESGTTTSTSEQSTSEQSASEQPSGEQATSGQESSPAESSGSAGESGQPADGTACQTGDIDVTLAKGDAAAGSYYAPLRLRNTGDQSCTLSGYPGVSYVAGGNNHQVGPSAKRADGNSPEVMLKPGDVAHATVRFVRVDNYPAKKCDPTDVQGIRVYLPGQKDSTVVSKSGTGCGNDDMSGSQLAVEPVQPGAGGR